MGDWGTSKIISGGSCNVVRYWSLDVSTRTLIAWMNLTRRLIAWMNSNEKRQSIVVMNCRLDELSDERLQFALSIIPSLLEAIARYVALPRGHPDYLRDIANAMAIRQVFNDRSLFVGQTISPFGKVYLEACQFCGSELIGVVQFAYCVFG